MNEIAEVTEMKRGVECCIKSLEPDIESYSIAAEEKSDVSLLAKANSFLPYCVRKKKELISELGCALEKLNDELKNILRNMKKSLVFCFCEIYSMVFNTKKTCLGLQKFFFGGRGFQRGFQKPYAPPPLSQHFVLGTSAYFSVFVYCFGWIFLLLKWEIA